MALEARHIILLSVDELEYSDERLQFCEAKQQLL